MRHTSSSSSLALIAVLLLLGVCAVAAATHEACPLVRQNALRHAKKLVTAHNASEFIQSYAESMKIKEVLELWLEYECEEIETLAAPLEAHASTAFSLMSTIASIAASHLNEEIHNIVASLTSLKNHLEILHSKGLDQSIEQSVLALKSEPSNWSCAICDIIMKLAENDALLKKQNIADYMSSTFCKLFPQVLKDSCEKFVSTVAPYLIEAQLNKGNADWICAKAGACSGKYLQCHIDGQSNPNPEVSTLEEYFSFARPNVQQYTSSFVWLSELAKSFADDHSPTVDLDGDGFSTRPTMRGYNWRGKDCNDLNKDIYPGVNIYSGRDKSVDYNCNLIAGTNKKTGKTYEEELCAGTQQYGFLTMGDSAGAHFSIPPAYLNVTLWSDKPFDDIIDRISNSFDLPHKSASTGYEFTDSKVNSLYKYLLESNRCNRNDYQNLGVNGADSKDSLGNIRSLRRDQLKDHPLFMVFELIGNDVCDETHSFSYMTKPEFFREKVLEMWRYLDTRVPAGSHMIVWGLADGRALYNTLKDKLEPIGSSYPDFYDYLNCLDLSPCWGYMNSNSDIRDGTANWAHKLNQEYKNILADPTIKFANFDIVYYDLPIEEIFMMATANGYTHQDIIEPVDGFHPSQLANFYIAEVFWRNIKRDRPQWIPKVNPNNAQIDLLFGSPFGTATIAQE